MENSGEYTVLCRKIGDYLYILLSWICISNQMGFKGLYRLNEVIAIGYAHSLKTFHYLISWLLYYFLEHGKCELYFFGIISLCSTILVHLLFPVTTPGTSRLTLLRRLYCLRWRGINTVLIGTGRVASLSLGELDLFVKHEVRIVSPPLA